MNIPAQVEKTLTEFALANKNQTILVGVSGGVDSMVLASVLLQLEFRIGIAHANHKLRGEESEGDEESVRSFAKKNDVEFFSSAQTVQGSAIQEEARKKRYQWFKRLKQEKNFDHIALGHNADDNFETALFHLIKGEGILNHRGIPVRSDEVIRPLLFCTRKEILEYANNQGLKWREDSSNGEIKYARNLLRNEIIPQLRSINPSLEKTYQRDYRRELEAREILIPLLELSRDWIREGENEIEIDLKLLKEIPGWFLALEYYLRSVGYHSEQSEELRKFLDSGSGSRFFVGEQELNMDRGRIIISRSMEKGKVFTIDESDLPYSLDIRERTYFLEKEDQNDQRDLKADVVEYIDYQKLEWPLEIRPWKEGDSFQPLGMKGKKKVSDLLIDKKIPISQKAGMHVLLSAGKIAMVIGLQISDEFKLDSLSSMVLAIRET